ncbi:protein NRT1/ PTR FAMILY 5.10-like [Lolium rigidum]|uniref:protein NRT1/ PTR FAMILY 5.10-like n=1 Tax=Lolium rigidum TaxID=89674 RepID=UPI001F5C1ED0|nr:protein NRT1/ PTR FAMILY 5.10-like [Lolium rigidum]
MDSGALLPQGDPSTVIKPGGGGGWPAALFLIAVEFAERVGFYGVNGNLIMYLTGPLGLTTAAAAAGVNAWAGTASMLPLLGALVADSWIGRYRAVVAAGVLYLVSFGMLTASSMAPTPRPHEPTACQDASAACSPPASPARTAFFYATIYLVALAQGFHKPNAQALGADQFPTSAPEGVASRSSFFNWLHFSMSWGYIVAVVALSYMQDNVGWAAGFGASWSMMLVSLSVFLLGTRMYRADRPRDGRALSRLTKTFAATARACADWIFRRRGTMDTECSPTPKEQDGKRVLVKLLPIWTTSVVYGIVIAQVSTLFTKQGSTMDRRIGGLVVPPAALQSFTGLAIIAFVPLYDRAFVPLARRVTKHPSGITMLQRIGAGMAMASVAMAVAALVEAARLRAASDAGLVDRPQVAVPMSLWWMVPQYVLIGLADVFTIIGLEEFFYSQVPEALRSVGLALSLSAMGVGSYASGILVSATDWVTKRTGDSWFSENLNLAHLDYFYWVLAGLAALEVFVFLYLAKGYVYTDRCELDDTSV